MKSKVRRYQPGQAIFMQGDPAKEMFLIKAGRVRLSKIMEDGDEITIDIRKAGDFFGENMLSEEIHYPFRRGVWKRSCFAALPRSVSRNWFWSIPISDCKSSGI